MKATRDPPTLPYLSRIAARKLGANEDRDTVIPTGEILYFFSGSAPAQGIIHAPWVGQARFHADRIYAGTRKGIFRTHYRTLRELLEHLDPNAFSPIHKSLVVNLDRISVPDLRGKKKQVGILLADGSDWLTVSRRHANALRSRLGYPERRVAQKRTGRSEA